ncbi:MAG: hypothetical protein ACI9HU_001057 [Colwellia sp.]
MYLYGIKHGPAMVNKNFINMKFRQKKPALLLKDMLVFISII